MTIADLQKLIDDALPGDEVCVPAGRFEGQLVIAKALTLKGEGPGVSILDAAGKGLALAVDARYEAVRIVGLTVTGGLGAQVGGGLGITNGARVKVEDCHFERNRSTGRGGAVNLERGHLELHRCTIAENEALEGGGLYVGGDATALVSECMFAWNVASRRGGGLAAIDGAQVRVQDTRFESNAAEEAGHHVFARSTTSRHPKVTLERASLGAPNGEGPSIATQKDYEGSFVLVGTAWPEDSRGTPQTRPPR